MQKHCWFCGTQLGAESGGQTGFGIPSMVYCSLAFFTIPELDDDAAFQHELHNSAAICLKCLQGLRERCQPPSDAYLAAAGELVTLTSNETLSTDTQLHTYEEREFLWYDWFRELPQRGIREWFQGLSIGELFDGGFRFTNSVILPPEHVERFLSRLETAGDFQQVAGPKDSQFSEHICVVFGPQSPRTVLSLWHTRVHISDYSVIKYL